MLITAIGGVVGILVVLLDEWTANQWLRIVWVMLGVLVTMGGCRLAKAPDFSARIGAVTLILVALTLSGTNRIPYAIFRLLSTLGGGLVVLVVAAVNGLFEKKIIA